MAKEAATFPLVLPPRAAGTPTWRWLCTALRAEILEGRLHPGARLPASRDLAAQYGLSRGTIVVAFEQLRSEGYLAGRVGSGTYISQVLPDDLLNVARRFGAAPSQQVRPSRRRLSAYTRRLKPYVSVEARPASAFRVHMPALDLFPASLWAQVSARRLRRVTPKLLSGGEPMGYRPLQVAVADYLVSSRGVRCAPEQVAIVTGVQEALDIAARLFLNPGDKAAVEDPGYEGVTAAFESVGAKVAPVPVDDEGLVVRGTALRGARLVCVTPAHQFPLGIAMSLPRRLELLEWARTSGALIFEDDYDSEFRYSGRPLPALQGLDRAGAVLFAGSFSKVLFPSLRLGYLVVPPDLVPVVESAKAVTNRHAPLPDQAVLADFIVEGHFGRHLRRMREVYAERLSALLEAAKQRLAGRLDISNLEAGIQTIGWLADGLNGEVVAKAAAARGVQVIPLSRYRRRQPLREGLQLGFAAVDAREIQRGVRELAAILR